MIERVNSITQNHPIRRIRLPIDYHVLILLVIEGLSRWIEVLSINERRKMLWAKRSLIYLKERTDLICFKKEEEIYILIEEKNKIVTWIRFSFFASWWMMIEQGRFLCYRWMKICVLVYHFIQRECDNHYVLRLSLISRPDDNRY